MNESSDYYRMKPERALAALGAHAKGLTPAEAARRLHVHGSNTLHVPQQGRLSFLRHDVPSQALGIAALLALSINAYTLAFALVAAFYINASISHSSAHKSRRFLTHLQHTLSKQQAVHRDGKLMEIDHHELVPGDIIVFERSELIAADVRVLSSSKLVVDEHMLTGSDQLVHKNARNLAIETAVPSTMVATGSRIVSGTGTGVVVATGSDTALARQAEDMQSAVLLSPWRSQLHHTRQWLSGLLLVSVIGLSLVAWFTNTSASTLAERLIVAIVALVPSGLTAELFLFAHARTEHRTNRLAAAQHVIRTALGDVSAKSMLVTISLVGYFGWHIPLAITALPLLVFDLLLQPFAISSLSWDKLPLKTPPHEAPDHPLRRSLAFGALAAGLAYANFVYFFVRHGLALSYMNNTSTLYRQAMSLAFATLVLCQAINLLMVRAHHRQLFADSFLWQNRRLWLGFGITAALLLGIIYAPAVQAVLGTASLSSGDWLVAAVAALLYLLTGLVQRSTRHHSRSAVIHMHHHLGLTSSIK